MVFSDLLTKLVTVSAALLHTSAALTGLVVSENTQENPEDQTVSSTFLVLSTTQTNQTYLGHFCLNHAKCEFRGYYMSAHVSLNL